MEAGDLYEVESIEAEKRDAEGQLCYLIKWSGFGHDSNTWEPEANIVQCDDVLRTWHQKQTEQPPQEKKEKKEPLTIPGAPAATEGRRRLSRRQSTIASSKSLKSEQRQRQVMKERRRTTKITRLRHSLSEAKKSSVPEGHEKMSYLVQCALDMAELDWARFEIETRRLNLLPDASVLRMTSSTMSASNKIAADAKSDSTEGKIKFSSTSTSQLQVEGADSTGMESVENLYCQQFPSSERTDNKHRCGPSLHSSEAPDQRHPNSLFCLANLTPAPTIRRTEH